MMRPGYLGGFNRMMPKAVRSQRRRRRLQRRRGFSGLGAFGKGFVAPPPPGEPTSVKPPSTLPLKNAVNMKTGKWYQQDVRCPEGEMMREVAEPCQGADCCDAPGDCDPPGTIYKELECDTDPAYRQLPPPPAGGWPDCDAFYKAGYLPPCDKKTCPSCFAEKPKPKQETQEAAPSQVVIIAPPQAAPPQPQGPSPEELAFEREIEALEEEAEEIPEDIPQPEAAPPPVYTGSPAPIVPKRAMPKGPATTEEKVQKLVSQYQEQKVVDKYQSPVRTTILMAPGMTGPGPAAGGPSRRGPAPRSKGRGPASGPAPAGPPKQGLVNKVFGWLNQTLFG